MAKRIPDDIATDESLLNACKNVNPLHLRTGKRIINTDISLNEIESGLWLGNIAAATDVETLKQKQIDCILTVDSCPLPYHIEQITSIKKKYVQVNDVKTEDLLSHLMQCIGFIQESLENSKNVLVHCQYGVSRSSAVVISFIMKKYNLTYFEAFKRVKIKRPVILPNLGFVGQLKLFYEMGHKIDPASKRYKTFRLRFAADRVRKAKRLPQSFNDLIKPDPALTQTNPEPIVYRCRKCRRVVASKSNILAHKPKTFDTIAQQDIEVYPTTTEDEYGLHSAEVADHMSGAAEVVDQLSGALKAQVLSNDVTPDTNSSAAIVSDNCNKIFFVEPIAWMKDVNYQTQGKLYCPKCNSKLGNFSWVMGCQCPCGVQVSPAFYLVPSKVELSKVVQNVQTTV